ncbi:3-hydroxyacyl-CoA dehydrogenase family protein [Pseudonocardia acaciae]|uniref:3-hydroxyacyl-CoA dehydrogenase family protein n=1 Tax=Pseudonocardia acaciae TaxID=551276 RepID=UPI00048F7F1D|nr:3-hydroxyacyl-CoA dehydrogenase NAD-binding domain-containing protein [Pseudonocardia acaciae]
MRFTKVAVLGFGTMGAGIAQVCAQAGLPVTVLETDAARIAAGRERLEAFLDGGVARGKLTRDDRTAVLDRVAATTEVAGLAGADLVIEAVVEELEIKRALLPSVAAAVGPDAVLATNTSALAVTQLAAAVPRPERFAGLHFFNPAPVMKLVEVVRALQTDQATVDALLAFADEVGKVAVEAPDRPGFLVNHLLMPYLNDVVQAYDDHLATAEDIDLALELGLGYPKGPLALLDLIGLDVHEHATANAYGETLDPQFAPPPLLRRMVAAGYLGAKSGRGFRTGLQEGT